MTNILKILKNSTIYLTIFLLIVYKGAFINLLANINQFFFKPNDKTAEVNILKEKVANLENELSKVTDILPYAKYNYDLTRLSYRVTYNAHEIYILNGTNHNYQKNMAVINERGLVGIIKEVNYDYSKVTLLPNIQNLSVEINGNYGTLTKQEDDLFVIENISNYDTIKLNDIAYTSTYGTIKERVPIGYVFKIDEGSIAKSIYIKSNVNFLDINYLYVVGDI